VCLAVLGAGLLTAATAGAEQPRAAFWRLVEAAEGGLLEFGPNPGGDTQILIGLLPLRDLAKLPLLVVFPGCGEDPATPNRPILNLEAVLQHGAEPEYGKAADQGPRWRLCPDECAVLLWPGQAGELELALDFLARFSGGLSPRLEGEVHILSEEDLRNVVPGRNPAPQLAKLVGRRSPAASVVVDLHYQVDAEKQAFQLGSWHQVYGKPDKNPLSGRGTRDYLQGAEQLPVDLLSFRAAMPIPRQTEDDGGRRFRRTLRRVLRKGSGLVGDKVCYREPYRVQLPLGGVFLQQALLANYSLSGRFSTRWTSDHSLHPGFGFGSSASGAVSPAAGFNRTGPGAFRSR
jgi:hypothetical protein